MCTDSRHAHKYNVCPECAHVCTLNRGNNATICTSSTNKLCKPKTVQDLTISARKSSMSNRFKALERFLSLRDFINHSYSSCGLGNIIHNFHTKYEESVKGCFGLSENIGLSFVSPKHLSTSFVF